MFKPLIPTLSLLSATALTALPAWADVPQVVTDIAPIHGLTARVMDGVGSPALLVDPGASPHSYTLRPSNAAALEQAELVIWIGAALTPSLERSIATLADEAQVLGLLEAAQTTVYDTRQDARLNVANDDNDHDEDHDHAHHDHDHGHDDDAHDDHNDHDDHAHDDHAHDDHGHDDHGHDGADPHAWLSPENGKVWLSLIADQLATLDPENADTYRANAAAGAEEIAAAQADISAQLASLASTPYVVFHDAYQYFEQAFDLSPVGAISLSDASDPSPARIAEIRETVAESGATCVFSEPQFNAGLVNTVFEGSTARTGVLDPLGTALPQGPDFYPALLRGMADAMAECL